MQAEYYFELVPIEKLFFEGTQEPQYAPISKPVYKQVQAYDKEIGGIDLGTGIFFRPGTSFFLIRKKENVVGWIIGAQATFSSISSEQKSFMPLAMYVVPEERGKINMRTIASNLFKALRTSKFDIYYFEPDAPGMVTKKGNEILRLFARVAEKEALGKNEGISQAGLIFNKSHIEEMIAKAKAQRKPWWVKEGEKARGKKTFLGRTKQKIKQGLVATKTKTARALSLFRRR